MSEKNVDTYQPPAALPRRGGWRRAVWQAVLALVIFGSGAAVGACVSGMIRDSKAEYNRKHPEKAPERFAERMADRLDLSRDQTAALKDIIQRRWQGLQDIRAEMYPKFKVLLDEIRQDMAGTLTPDQLRKWDEYVADMTRSWRPTTNPATSGS